MSEIITIWRTATEASAVWSEKTYLKWGECTSTTWSGFGESTQVLKSTIKSVFDASFYETLDGGCTMSFSVPYSNVSDVAVGDTVRYGSVYWFRITGISKSLSNRIAKATISCEHISYKLNDVTYTGSDATGTCGTLLAMILSGTGFTAGSCSDFSASKLLDTTSGESRRTLLTRLVDLFEGELVYNGMTINIVSHRGTTTRYELINEARDVNTSITDDGDNYTISLYKPSGLALGDDVHVGYSALGISQNTRILGLRYNPFYTQDVNVTVGDYIHDLNDVLSGIEAEIGDVEESVTDLTVDVNGIHTTVSSVQQSLTGTQTDVSTLQQTAEGLTSTVSTKVGKDEIASTINQTAQSVLIEANKLDLTALSADLRIPAVNIDGDVTANKFRGNSITTEYASLTGSVETNLIKGFARENATKYNVNVTFSNLTASQAESANNVFNLYCTVSTSDVSLTSYTGYTTIYVKLAWTATTVVNNSYTCTDQIYSELEETVKIEKLVPGTPQTIWLGTITCQDTRQVTYNRTTLASWVETASFSNTSANNITLSGVFTVTDAVCYCSNVSAGTYYWCGLSSSSSDIPFSSITQTIEFAQDTNTTIQIGSTLEPSETSTYDLGSRSTTADFTPTITITSLVWNDGSSSSTYDYLPKDADITLTISNLPSSAQYVQFDDFYFLVRSDSGSHEIKQALLQQLGMVQTSGATSITMTKTVTLSWYSGTSYAFIQLEDYESVASTSDTAVETSFTATGINSMSYFRDAYIYNGVTTGSARVYKQDIETLDSRYDEFVMSLIPRRYKYKDGSSERYHTGFIVDEVADAMQAAGLTSSEFAGYILADPDNPDGDGGLRYEEFIAMLLRYIQTLSVRVDDLENQINNQKG